MRAACQFTGKGPNANAPSLAPGFSPVFKPRCNQNRFNGFPSGGPKPLKRFFALATNNTGLKPGAKERTPLTLWPLAARSIGPVVGLLFLALSACAQQPTTNDVRFLAVDIYVDSKGKPLAAYQLEFSVTNGNAKIVGIEGGEHQAFREPPHYDPKAIQKERVIIAAYSTAPTSQLPSTRVRVATIHVQFNEGGNPQFGFGELIIANSRGVAISAEADFQFRKTK